MIEIQHHHAHMASCMADNHLEGKVFAVILDGTGYGLDGIFGGLKSYMVIIKNFNV